MRIPRIDQRLFPRDNTEVVIPGVVDIEDASPSDIDGRIAVIVSLALVALVVLFFVFMGLLYCYNSGIPDKLSGYFLNEEDRNDISCRKHKKGTRLMRPQYKAKMAEHARRVTEAFNKLNSPDVLEMRRQPYSSFGLDKRRKTSHNETAVHRMSAPIVMSLTNLPLRNRYDDNGMTAVDYIDGRNALLSSKFKALRSQAIRPVYGLDRAVRHDRRTILQLSDLPGLVCGSTSSRVTFQTIEDDDHNTIPVVEMEDARSPLERPDGDCIPGSVDLPLYKVGICTPPTTDYLAQDNAVRHDSQCNHPHRNATTYASRAHSSFNDSTGDIYSTIHWENVPPNDSYRPIPKYKTLDDAPSDHETGEQPHARPLRESWDHTPPITVGQPIDCELIELPANGQTVKAHAAHQTSPAIARRPARDLFSDMTEGPSSHTAETASDIEEIVDRDFDHFIRATTAGPRSKESWIHTPLDTYRPVPEPAIAENAASTAANTSVAKFVSSPGLECPNPQGLVSLTTDQESPLDNAAMILHEPAGMTTPVPKTGDSAPPALSCIDTVHAEAQPSYDCNATSVTRESVHLSQEYVGKGSSWIRTPSQRGGDLVDAFFPVTQQEPAVHAPRHIDLRHLPAQSFVSAKSVQQLLAPSNPWTSSASSILPDLTAAAATTAPVGHGVAVGGTTKAAARSAVLSLSSSDDSDQDFALLPAQGSRIMPRTFDDAGAKYGELLERTPEVWINHKTGHVREPSGHSRPSKSRDKSKRSCNDA